jgi:hypothetical protein
MTAVAERREPSFADLPNATILAVIDIMEGDGRMILKPEALLERGVPEPLVSSLSETHYSDGSHKGSIYSPEDGGMGITEPLDHVTGVDGMTLYYRICSDLGLPSGTPYDGRRKISSTLHSRIVEFLASRDG